jgi:cell wall-associated NlpC family hydrolase
MIVTRDEIVSTARTYLDTPFQHQGRRRGVGVDCAGLVTCVAYDLGMRDVRIAGYSQQPDEGEFRATLREHMDVIQYSDVAPGDVLTFRFSAEQHVAIVTKIDPIWIIHSFGMAKRVIEQPLDAAWLARLRGCYRFREAEPWLF